jgi:putative spermidine/putrescine transport system ATP-binding protein
MAYLELRNVQKKFGTIAAVESFDLKIERGEFVSFLGPSGCGKTTTLRMVAGFETPTAGTILINDKDMTQVPPNKRNVGMVFQSYALFPNMTVADNIGFGLRIGRQSSDEINKRVREMLALIKMDSFGDRYPYQLSGGQQQRVALARALAIHPQVLLLDEPLSALDAKIRVSLRNEIRAIQRQLGITSIYVTHDQEEALTMADLVVVMDGGRIVQVGAPREVYRKPATPFVAGFVGLMNFLPGVMAAGRVAQVRCGSALLQVPADAQSLAPGSEVVVAIRPEDVRILQNGFDVTNVVETSVHEIEFLGPFQRLHLRLPQQAGSALDLTAYLDPGGQAKPVYKGAHLEIHLPVQALRVYPAQP